jgi:tripartite-type tricarboxylate transporter receptor subunit TctC
MNSRMILLVCLSIAWTTNSSLAMSSSHVERYPTKPIRFILVSGPGSVSDVMMRMVGERLTAMWGQPVVVDMRSGAGGIIGVEIGSRAAPDGYTIVVVNTSFAINASLQRKTSYDPVKDFSPVTFLGSTPLLLVVHPSFPAHSVKELIAVAKSRPAQLSYGSPGIGSGWHLATELFKAMAGVDLTHVTYKGAAPAELDLMAGRIEMMFDNIVPALPHVKSGKLRALAVTGLRRSPLAPNVPTIDEAALAGYEYTGWFGAVVPAGTTRDIIAKLSSEIGKIMNMPEIEQRLSSMGLEPATSTPEQFGAYIKAQIAKWAKVIKQSGARIE